MLTCVEKVWVAKRKESRKAHRTPEMNINLTRGRAQHESSTMTTVILSVPDSFGIILMKHYNTAMALL